LHIVTYISVNQSNPIFMNTKVRTFSILALVLLVSTTTVGQENHYFSAVQGKASKADSIILVSVKPKMIKAQITGEQAKNFKLLSISQGTEENIVNTIVKFRFEPSTEANGISRAALKIKRRGKTLMVNNLRGMGIPALEGENEASLSSVLDLLDIGTNIGWTTSYQARITR